MTRHKDAYVQLALCRLCGAELEQMVLTKELPKMADHSVRSEGKPPDVYTDEPCEECKKMFAEGYRYFVGDCGHCGFIKYEELQKALVPDALEYLGDDLIFKIEQCFHCLGIVEGEADKMERTPQVVGAAFGREQAPKVS